MRFSRQEYWSGLPFPSPGDLPHLGIELTSLKSALTGGLFTTSALWENPHAYWPPAYSLWRNVYLKSLPVFQLVYLLLLSCKSSLHIPDKILENIQCANILLHFVSCLFTFLTASFEEPKFSVLSLCFWYQS